MTRQTIKELTQAKHCMLDRLTGQLTLFLDVMTDLGAGVGSFTTNLVDHNIELAMYFNN